MTTIAWDGKILAVDSRSSTTEAKMTDREDVRDMRICFHCEKPAWVGIDNVVKLTLYPKLQFREEKVRAVCMTGLSQMCERLHRVFRTEAGEFEAIWKHYALLRGSHLRDVSVGMLVLTDTKLYRVHMEGVKIEAFAENLEKPLAMGSGNKLALMAMNTFGLNAVDGVIAARATDAATGGPIRYFDFSQPLPVEGKAPELSEMPAMSREEAQVYIKQAFAKPLVVTQSVKTDHLRKPRTSRKVV